LTPRYWFPKHYADEVQRLRVPLGFVMAAAFAWLASPTRVSLMIGLPVSVLGLAIRAWAAGHLAKNESLAISGPYSYIRNPLYAGTLLAATGLVAASREVWLAALAGAVFLLVYLPAIELEEQHLRKLFPGYDAYAAKVPLLIPRGKRVASPARFRFSLYIRNREYQALLGFLIGAIFLGCKMRLLTGAWWR
jgi:protein-S-isoprenylcysteine O-methyltransferase Ste14